MKLSFLFSTVSVAFATLTGSMVHAPSSTPLFKVVSPGAMRRLPDFQHSLRQNSLQQNTGLRRTQRDVHATLQVDNPQLLYFSEKVQALISSIDEIWDAGINQLDVLQCLLLEDIPKLAYENERCHVVSALFKTIRKKEEEILKKEAEITEGYDTTSEAEDTLRTLKKKHLPNFMKRFVFQQSNVILETLSGSLYRMRLLREQVFQLVYLPDEESYGETVVFSKVKAFEGIETNADKLPEFSLGQQRSSEERWRTELWLSLAKKILILPPTEQPAVVQRFKDKLRRFNANIAALDNAPISIRHRNVWHNLTTVLNAYGEGEGEVTSDVYFFRR
jgi:hypothetical protein